jgi:hypothetical protein
MLLMVGQSVTEAANDKQQLDPMVAAIEQQSGQRPEAILADSGLLVREPDISGMGRAAGAQDRRVHRHRQAEAWRASIAV